MGRPEVGVVSEDLYQAVFTDLKTSVKSASFGLAPASMYALYTNAVLVRACVPSQLPTRSLCLDSWFLLPLTAQNGGRGRGPLGAGSPQRSAVNKTPALFPASIAASSIGAGVSENAAVWRPKLSETLGGPVVASRVWLGGVSVTD